MNIINLYDLRLIGEQVMYRLFIIILCLTASMVHAMSIPDAAEDCYRQNIFRAKTVQEAQKDINRGALNKLCNEEKFRLFSRAMQPDCESGLIPLYKAHGLNWLKLCSPKQCTMLMLLVAESRPGQNNLIEKAELLLQDFSYEQKCNLIRQKTIFGDTVFDIINRIIIGEMIKSVTPQLNSFRVLSQLTALRSFLQGVLKKESSCAICFDPLNSEECKTINDLKVHPTCKSWVKQNIKGYDVD